MPSSMQIAAPRRPAVLVIGAIAIYRFSLLGRGAMAFLDETLYYKAAQALEALRAGHVAAAFVPLADTTARPANAVLQMIPASLQAIPFAFGVAPSNPRSLLIPVIFNALLTIASLVLFWRISLIVLDGDETAAAVATAINGLLANNNVYVRHLLAAEPGLLAGMVALWYAVSRPASVPRSTVTGMLAAVAFVVYPGYYLFAAIPCIVALGVAEPAGWGQRLKRLAACGAGGSAILLLTEVGCRIGGRSYANELWRIRHSIQQGALDEGWVFLPRYLVQVEHAIGVVLLAGVAVWIVLLASDAIHRRPITVLHWIVALAIGGWLFQAFNSAQQHSMVLYGRLIHPWMSFMTWATVYAIRRAPALAVRRAAYAVAVGAAVASWAIFANEYRQLRYPIDELYALGIDTARVPAAQQRCELDPWYVATSPGPLNRATGAPYSARTDYLLINFCMGAPLAAAPPPEAVAPGMALLYRARHFISFRAYGFEGFTPAQRDAAEASATDLRVYQPAGGAAR